MTPGQLKLIAILGVLAVLVGGSATVAWNYRSALAEKETREAVEGAVTTKLNEIKTKLDEESAARVEAQAKADVVLQALQASVEQIRTLRGQTQVLVARDREANKSFYDQPIPEAGRQAWLNARAAAVSPPESPASAPPAASSPR